MKNFNTLAALMLGEVMVFGFLSCKPEVEYVDKTYAAAPAFTITQNDNGTFSVAIACATEGTTISVTMTSATQGLFVSYTFITLYLLS